ncbi:hypothetical protein Tco_0379602, partial [Tanacetum coccineum]
MENPNHLNEPNEAIPEVNPVVPEPNQVVDIHDPNEMVDIPDDIDLVDYDNEDPDEDPEEDPEEEPKEEPEEDVEIELDNDAELYFLMMWRVTKPRHLEMCHSILIQRTRRSMLHPRLLLGLLPKILMPLVPSRENKIGEKERELLNHDLENVERVSVLERWENATLKKRLAVTETKLEWACMDRDIAKRRLHESRVWNKMFYLDMVCIRAVSKPPSDDEDTELAASMAEFMANMNRRAGGDEAGGAGAGGGGADGARAGGAGAGGAGAGGARAGGAGAGGARVGGAGPAAPEITVCTYVTFMKCDPQPFKG